MKKRKEFWAGYVNGAVMVHDIDDGWGGFGTGLVRSPFLFAKKSDAQERFEDVRKVRIVEVNPKRKRP